jgi:phospholipid/cholesterol/gamma-HCH transport system substrate-binding protein
VVRTVVVRALAAGRQMAAGRQLAASAVVLTLVAVGLSACGGGATKLTAYFDDSGDLQSRGGVQVADVRVGSIGRITLTKDFRSKVVLNLNPGVRVPKNSQALLRTTSLLGEKFVELRPLGNPGQGPFLANGDTGTNSGQAPELEFVAQSAVQLLGGVNADSIASLVDTGAQAFGNRGPQLRALIVDLNQISATLASRTTAIGQVIDNLDRATTTLAGGSQDLSALLVNLAHTSQILADNRQQAITALAALTHLATASDYSLQKYGADIDRQIKQIDVIVGAVANASSQVGSVLDWAAQFVQAVPKVIRNDYTQVFMWAVPAPLDARSGK